MAQRSRKALPLLEFSKALEQAVIRQHPPAQRAAQFYEHHVHDIRVTAHNLCRGAKRAVKDIRETNLRVNKALSTLSTSALRRLIDALVAFERESAPSGAFAGANSPRGGSRANHVHLWIAGILQGEAERFFGHDLRLPWAEIEGCLQVQCGEPKRDVAYLAKDVDRNREGTWFRRARDIGFRNSVEWPGLTRFR